MTTKKIRIEEEINFQKGDDYNFDYDEFRKFFPYDESNFKDLQKNTNYVKIDLNKYREKPIEVEYIEEILTVNKIKVITTIEEEIIPADQDETFNNAKPS